MGTPVKISAARTYYLILAVFIFTSMLGCSREKTALDGCHADNAACIYVSKRGDGLYDIGILNGSSSPIYVPWLESVVSPFSGFRVSPSGDQANENPGGPLGVSIVDSQESGLVRIPPNGFYGMVVDKGFFDRNYGISGGCHSLDVEFNATLLREDIPGSYLDRIHTGGIEVCL